MLEIDYDTVASLVIKSEQSNDNKSNFAEPSAKLPKYKILYAVMENYKPKRFSTAIASLSERTAGIDAEIVRVLGGGDLLIAALYAIDTPLNEYLGKDAFAGSALERRELTEANASYKVKCTLVTENGEFIRHCDFEKSLNNLLAHDHIEVVVRAMNLSSGYYRVLIMEVTPIERCVDKASPHAVYKQAVDDSIEKLAELCPQVIKSIRNARIFNLLK